MMKRCGWRAALLGGALGLVLLVDTARAGDCCACEDGARRTGRSQEVARCAVPSDTGHYVGYYVGGGAPCRGEPRCPDDGTWGWDYGGCLPKCVALGWWHGRRYQGGVGSYSTVGTKCRNTSTP